ncbi:MAG: helix-turn-helix domain-containing protein [Oscillospiraceae bacterium]|nr:helix-turn-helix domain-containing protein [Oscillospiraceae bacterium]
MFKIKARDGTNNLCGKRLAELRGKHNPPLSQRKLAQMLQVRGYDVDNHFIRRVELGERFVTDIEIVMLCEVLGIRFEELLTGD